MKIRSESELIDFLAHEKQIRKRELISLSQELSDKKGVHDRVKRAAIVFSYAHWEGFVKQASVAYLNLVCYKTKPLSSLKENFWALACRQELNSAQSATKKIEPHILLVSLLTTKLSRSFYIDANTAIDTESNLNSTVFKNICDSTGLTDKESWSTEEPFMDDLFRNRCAIAHGELYTPEKSYSIESTDKTIEWIDKYSNQIENAAINKSYLKQTPQ